MSNGFIETSERTRGTKKSLSGKSEATRASENPAGDGESTTSKSEFEAARREEPCDTSVIVKEVIVKGTVGNMSEFSMEEDCTRWFERLTHYFSDVPKEKQVSLFISLMGREGYELLCNLCTPENPVNLTLERNFLWKLCKSTCNHGQV